MAGGFHLVAIGQSALENQANKFYDNLQYASAVPLFEEILKKQPTNSSIKIKLADSYQKINDSKDAERVYESLIKDDPSDYISMYNYAEVLAQNGKYPEALTYFKKYKVINSNDPRTEAYISKLSNLKSMYYDSSAYKVQYLSINSPQADFSPAFYKKGLVFVSGRTKSVAMQNVYDWDHSAYLNLYYTEDTSQIKYNPYLTKTNVDMYTDKKYGNKDIHPKRMHTDDTYLTSNDTKTLGYYSHYFLNDSLDRINTSETPSSLFSEKLNTQYHEGPVAFFKSQDTIIFTRNNYSKGRFKKSEFGVNKLQMYWSFKGADGKWSLAQPFTFNNDNYSVGHPCLAPDNKTLYFVSDKSGGIGQTDIWMSQLVDGKWSEPVNAGPTINTLGNELFPTMDSKGTLFYASNGLGGLGGLDIYKAEYKNNAFASPKNLGYPINSMKDDFGIIWDSKGSKGYFSSNRKNSGTDDDIYGFTYIPRPINLLGIVKLKNSNKPISDCKISLKLIDAKRDTITPGTGTFYYNDLDREADYIIVAEKEGFITQNYPLTTKGVTPGETVLAEIIMDEYPKVTGTVTNQVDSSPEVNVKMVLKDMETGETKEVQTDSLGNYLFPLNPEKDYLLTVSKDKCGTLYEKFTTKNITNSHIIIDFKMICEGDKIKIENLYYDKDKYFIRPDAALELDKLLVYFQKYPSLKIELGSHTDCRSPIKYNLTLSENRAKSATSYLVEHGVNKANIKAKGYGESQLINDCACENGKVSRVCSEEEHQVNRRTEIKILSIK